jgi:signal transduction histidine kinase/ActR/RegA family two-component response regulator
MDYRVVLLNGETRWIHFVARFIRNEFGVVTHHRGVIVDVTGVRRTQERLTESELRGKTALESSQLKSEFVAMVSHELRTPLGGIIGLSDLLLATPLDEMQKELALNLKRSGESLLHIINDILDMSKVEAGKLEFESIDFDLADVLRDLSSLILLAASQKGLSFRVEAASTQGLRLHGDPMRLRQILMNLLSNAVKFTQTGDVALKVLEKNRSEERVELQFTVTDSGIGMSKETLEKLFRPFSQADSSMTRRFGGTGLGLSISKSLAEGMGGSVHVTSEPGQGSTFNVDLPFQLAAESLPEKPKPLVEGPAQGLASQIDATARVLVAEDVEVNRMVIGLMLNSLGLTPTFALNGQEALTALETTSFDLVLMDCQMPERDGYEVTRRLRAHPSLPPERRNVPVIAMTANALSGDRERCLEAGMNDYVSKPLSKEILAEALKRWIPSLHPRA